MFLQKHPNVLSFGQGFEDTSCNDINGIRIPEILMNIVSCHGFVNENTTTVILTHQRNLLSHQL